MNKKSNYTDIDNEAKIVFCLIGYVVFFVCLLVGSNKYATWEGRPTESTLELARIFDPDRAYLKHLGLESIEINGDVTSNVYITMEWAPDTPEVYARKIDFGFGCAGRWSYHPSSGEAYVSKATMQKHAKDRFMDSVTDCLPKILTKLRKTEEYVNRPDTWKQPSERSGDAVQLMTSNDY